MEQFPLGVFDELNPHILHFLLPLPGPNIELLSPTVQVATLCSGLNCLLLRPLRPFSTLNISTSILSFFFCVSFLTLLSLIGLHRDVLLPLLLSIYGISSSFHICMSVHTTGALLAFFTRFYSTLLVNTSQQK